ncbi:LysM peptidoglycan-binding domain-containing protein [Lacticaseibacillus jixianensis]|uniref:LysM peptidoglycan-binding domain-containing protein n=1 Tax=Lacticaseibacillus jixianensis TaxID=2486012 RepID=A0ABW4B6C6_9LACO|nr:LysM domain-containing protein [Lacticaseibacillus jixianensis]
MIIKNSHLAWLFSTAAALSTAVVIGQPNTTDAATTNDYVVKSGDTLSGIAAANDTSVAKLAAANKLADKNVIQIGQKLKVTDDTAKAATYTVKAGDTLSAIASHTGVSQSTLIQLNSIQNANMISVGQVLKLSGAPAAQPAKARPAATQAAAPKVVSAPRQTVKAAPVQQRTYAATSTSEAAAKAAIAQRESGGSYTARNGQYYGRYQLTVSYLHGDLSAANQERTADAYVAGRYGSWANALAHSNSYGWY